MDWTPRSGSRLHWFWGSAGGDKAREVLAALEKYYEEVSIETAAGEGEEDGYCDEF